MSREPTPGQAGKTLATATHHTGHPHAAPAARRTECHR